MPDKAVTTTRPAPQSGEEQPSTSAASASADAKAEEEAAQERAEEAEARLYTGDTLTYEEYDKIGKGKNYEPSDETKARTAASDKAVAEAAEATSG